LNPNPAPEFLGIKFIIIGEYPMVLARDRNYVSVVDLDSKTLVNLFVAPIEVDLMSTFYLDVIETEENFEIYTIEYVKGSIS
jgi:hypothetical protein